MGLYLKALRTKNPLSREIKKVLDSKREARAAQPPEQRIAECRQNQTKLLGQFNTAVDKAKKHYKVKDLSEVKGPWYAMGCLKCGETGRIRKTFRFWLKKPCTSCSPHADV